MADLILNFHGIGGVPDNVSPSEARLWWDLDEFRSILDQICRVRATTINRIGIAFDDGNASDIELALPELEIRGLKAIFFVCAGRIGKPGFLDARDITQLLDAGMGVGSHGMNHVDWRRIDEEQLTTEISTARRVLQSVSGPPIDMVSIPFGSYDRRVLARLQSEGFKHVYSSDGGLSNNDSWFKARNTLDRHFFGRSIIQLDYDCSTLHKRLRRWTLKYLKALR